MRTYAQTHVDGTTLPPTALDHAGATASSACALHCAAMPFVLSVLPAFGLGFLARESTEWALLGISAGLGLWSLCWGFRGHGSPRAFKILSAALLLLIGGHLLETRGGARVGVPMTVLGGLGLAVSHVVNKALCRSCLRCSG